jgi:hypothetical protein
MTTEMLTDIKTQFYAIIENYPTVYANFKATPDLPSARDAHDKTDAALTSLYRRMFAFQAAVEKELNENEETVGQLTTEGAQLNAKVARRTSIVNGRNAMMTPANASVIESFVSGLAEQLPGCNALDASGNATNCPCVLPGQNACYSGCGNQCPATAIQLSLVSEARDIEKSAYTYAIFRIIYLVVGIAVVSYFIFQTVGSPDSTILEDAKIKAEQLKTGIMNANANPSAGSGVNTTGFMNPITR